MTAIWTRFNSVMLVLVLLALLAIIGMLATGVRGGPLDPPGAPAPTDSVKLPGTPISSAPVTISQPGRYYLTRNIGILGAQIAVTINASDVTLDLGGFTISGNDSSPSWGIYLGGTQTNVTLTNGTVKDFQFGIDSGDDNRVTIDGVKALSNARGFNFGPKSLLSNCVSADNTETGVHVSSGNYLTVRNCVVTNNGGDGVSVAGGGEHQVERSRVYANSGVDIRVTGCCNVVRDNTVSGIRLESGTNWVVDNVCLVGDIVDVSSGNYRPIAGTAHDNAC